MDSGDRSIRWWITLRSSTLRRTRFGWGIGLEKNFSIIIKESIVRNLSMFSPEITSIDRARDNFLSLLDRVADEHKVWVIERAEGENVALIAESELRNLLETVYLLRSPTNARRLFEALEESRSGKILPSSIENLKQELENRRVD